MKRGNLIFLTMFFSMFLPAFWGMQAGCAEQPAVDPILLMSGMFNEVAAINDYKCILIKTEMYRKKLETEEVLYIFKRPKKIRMEWLKPKKGLRVFYNGEKLLVNPSGFIKFYLDPRSELAKGRSNHYIDESDLPSVVHRIKTGLSQSHVSVKLLAEEQAGDRILCKIELIAQKEEKDLYCRRAVFWIDREKKLPYILEFYDFRDMLFERFVYENLEINIGISDQEMIL